MLKTSIGDPITSKSFEFSKEPFGQSERFFVVNDLGRFETFKVVYGYFIDKDMRPTRMSAHRCEKT